MPLVLAAGLEQLHVGLLVTGGAGGLVVGGIAGTVPRARRLLAPAAALVAAVLLVTAGVADGWVVLAVAVPALAAVVPALSDDVPELASAGLAAVAAGVGALLLGPAASSLVVVPRAAVVVAFAALAGLAALAADRHLRPATTVALGAWTAFGLFLCNPDTEGASLTGALLAVGAVAAWLGGRLTGRRGARSSARPTVIGSATPMVLLLVWVGVQGAGGREETIISGYACLGVLLALPVAAGLALLVPREVGPTTRLLPGALVMAIQAPLVVVCARLGGVRTTAERALLVGAAALALATAVLALALGTARRDDEEATSQGVTSGRERPPR